MGGDCDQHKNTGYGKKPFILAHQHGRGSFRGYSHFVTAWVAVLIFPLSRGLGAVDGKGDGSACYNGCSGHGVCRRYSCECFPGFEGEDCSTNYANPRSSKLEAGETAEIRPILTVGSFNLTFKNFSSVTRSLEHVIVGFSSLSCSRCVRVESEYFLAVEMIGRNLSVSVPFARVDAVKEHRIAKDFGGMILPAIFYCSRGKCTLYEGEHRAKDIFQYVQKVTGPTVSNIKSIRAITQLQTHILQKRSHEGTAQSAAIGFFSDFRGAEEDEYEDVLDAAADLQTVWWTSMHVVRANDVIEHFRDNLRWFSRTPALVVLGGSHSANTVSAIPAVVQLDEFFGGSHGSLADWIKQVSLPLVGQLTHFNFAAYEKRGLPMGILFLDSDSSSSDHMSSESRELVQRLRDVAKFFRDELSFAYANGHQHLDKMRALGVLRGSSALPLLAMNTRSGQEDLPYLKATSLTRSAMHRYFEAFLAGTLGTRTTRELFSESAPAERANAGNAAEKSNYVVGVRERFDSGVDGVVVVSTSDGSFRRLALDESRDVVLLLHADDGTCHACENLAPYYKRVAKRFRQLEIKTVLVARMDVSACIPPTGLVVPKLPAIAILRAYNKEPPYPFFSGVAKVKPIMDWIQANAGRAFHLGELPQFDASDKELFKEQIHDRERRRQQATSLAASDEQNRVHPKKRKKRRKKKNKSKRRRTKKVKRSVKSRRQAHVLSADL